VKYNNNMMGSKCDTFVITINIAPITNQM